MSRFYLVLISALVFVLAAAPCANAREAVLKDITMTNTKEDLVVFFQVEGCFTEEMEDAILKGIPTTFTFLIQLDRTRGWWLDEEIAEINFTRTVKFDSLKKEFTVNSEKKENGEPEVAVVKDFERAKALMAKVEGFPVAKLDKLQKGEKYQLRIKAELEKVRLPLYLHYVFFFVSLWDFETDWYSVDFKY